METGPKWNHVFEGFIVKTYLSYSLLSLRQMEM